MIQHKLGRQIASLRRRKRMTQEQFAEALGLSVEFISLVERGVNAPSVANLEKFAAALEVDVKDLFTFDAKRGGAS